MDEEFVTLTEELEHIEQRLATMLKAARSPKRKQQSDAEAAEITEVQTQLSAAMKAAEINPRSDDLIASVRFLRKRLAVLVPPQESEPEKIENTTTAPVRLTCVTDGVEMRSDGTCPVCGRRQAHDPLPRHGESRLMTALRRGHGTTEPTRS